MTPRQILLPVPLVLLTPVANLPPVSTTPVANCYRYNDTGGKFATGVIEIRNGLNGILWG
jgi:hypothetical protein